MKRTIPAITLTFFLVLTAVAPCSSQETTEKEHTLSLKDAMLTALKHNFRLRNQRVAIQIDDQRELAATGIYDYQLANQVRFYMRESERFSSFEASGQSSQSAQSSMGRLLANGGFIELEGGLERSVSDALIAPLNPEYMATLTARYSQPLLRNSGREIIETNIIISGYKTEGSRLELEAAAQSLLNRVESVYWSLVSAREQRDVNRQAVELFREYLGVVMTRRELGEAARIEEVQARQRLAQAESDLVDAEAMVDQLEDRLKTLLVGVEWETELLPSDDIATGQTIDGTLADCIARAETNRIEFALLSLRKNILSTQTRFAENQARPELTVFAEAQLAGRAGEFQPSFIDSVSPYPERDTFPDSLTNLLDFDNGGVAVGATYRFSFENTQAKAEVEVARLRERQIEIERQELRHVITSEIRSALREIKSANAQISSRKAAVELAQAEYDAELERLALGESTSFLTLEALVKLNQAKSSLVTARGKLALAYVSYNTALGITLEQAGIELTFPELGNHSTTP